MMQSSMINRLGAIFLRAPLGVAVR